MNTVAKYIFILLILLCSFSKTEAQQSRTPELNSPLHLPPEVNFGWTHACFGDTTRFFNATLRPGTYQWYVFDKLGDTLYRSTNTNISYYFPSSDTFYVFLQSDNGHIVSLQDTIIIGNNLKAGFSFMHCSNLFLNQSLCGKTFSWDFGDGSTSIDSIPTHEYSDTGKYNVTLIAHDGLSVDTFKQTIYITVVGLADGAFTLNLSNDTLFYQINHFVPYSNIYWGFGDGGTSNSQQGYYVYTTSGNYSIYLNQTNGCGIIMHDTTIQVSVPMGIKQINNDNNFTVSPNPSFNGIFTILGINQSSSVEVLDMLGNILLNQSSSQNTIDLSNFASGQYILKICDSKNTFTKKLIR